MESILIGALQLLFLRVPVAFALGSLGMVLLGQRFADRCPTAPFWHHG